MYNVISMLFIIKYNYLKHHYYDLKFYDLLFSINLIDTYTFNRLRVMLG